MLINYLSISIQIHVVTWNKVKNGPSRNIMCVKCMDMIALEEYYVCKMHEHDCLERDSMSQYLHLIQSLNLRTKSPRDCCARKMLSFFSRHD
jgi:hypothetical protein